MEQSCAALSLWYNFLILGRDGDPLHRETSCDLVYYTFESLQAYCGVTHAISTRHGGYSSKPYDALNLGKTVGDDPALVNQNIRALHTALDLNPAMTVYARQARADGVTVVRQADAGRVVPDVDALVTNERGLALMLKYADCVPILLFDPVHRAAGVVHAGWSGTVMRVLTNAVSAMADSLGTKPADVVAGIGPSIGPCCYCVGPDVIARVRMAFPAHDDLLQERDGHVFFDLWEANRRQLLELGVRRIETAAICTSDHVEDFYSARAERPATGRFGAVIALR